jgi:hypothetical protein
VQQVSRMVRNGIDYVRSARVDRKVCTLRLRCQCVRRLRARKLGVPG